jgi:hypothetical protein
VTASEDRLDHHLGAQVILTSQLEVLLIEWSRNGVA